MLFQETASAIGSNDEEADGYNTESDEDSQDTDKYTSNTSCDQDRTENFEMDEREERQVTLYQIYLRVLAIKIQID